MVIILMIYAFAATYYIINVHKVHDTSLEEIRFKYELTRQSDLLYYHKYKIALEYLEKQNTTPVWTSAWYKHKPVIDRILND